MGGGNLRKVIFLMLFFLFMSSSACAEDLKSVYDSFIDREIFDISSEIFPEFCAEKLIVLHNYKWIFIYKVFVVFHH